jgi:O-antigen/teichoic acid export membrane protein
MNLIRGFVSVLGSKIGVIFLGVIITPLLVRFLGSSLYGDYAFLLSVLSVTMILVNAGIFDGTRKFLAEDRGYSEWVEQVFGFYLRVAFVLATLAAAIYAAFSWYGFTERVLGSGFEVYFYLLGLLVVARQANSVVRGGLMGLGLESKSEPLLVLRKLLFGISTLALLYLGYDIAGVLVGHIFATLTVMTLGYVIFFRYVDIRSVFTPIHEGFPKRELLSFNSLSVVLILLTASLYHVDILLLRLIAGDQATGYYRAALVIAEFLWFVPNTLQTVLLHSSSELWANEETDRISALTSRTTRYNLSLTLLLTIGIASLASEFVPLYFGPEFNPTVLPLLLLLPGAVGFALARPIFAVGQGKGSLRPLIAATGAASVLNLVLNLILIPKHGMAGAAVATSIGYGVMILFHIWAARRVGFNPIADLRLPRIAVTAIITAAIIFPTSTAIGSPIGSLLIVPPLGFIVYSGLSIKLGVVPPKEILPAVSRLPEPLEGYIRAGIRALQ